MAIIAMLSVLKYKEQLYSHIIGANRLGIKISLISELIDSLMILGNNSSTDFGKRIINRLEQ
ncbi:MAG: hypothetical protein A2V93_01665 [Ignavibacteria bacterium RBG_16_34_14]|nr:MAG: hypothetical protein A2V93_01665 [Ignavibacteria bacterium RBG_16_34_14]